LQSNHIKYQTYLNSENNELKKKPFYNRFYPFDKIKKRKKYHPIEIILEIHEDKCINHSWMSANKDGNIPEKNSHAQQSSISPRGNKASLKYLQLLNMRRIKASSTAFNTKRTATLLSGHCTHSPDNLNSIFNNKKRKGISLIFTRFCKLIQLRRLCTLSQVKSIFYSNPLGANPPHLACYHCTHPHGRF
jgi:hypothetical protein